MSNLFVFTVNGKLNYDISKLIPGIGALADVEVGVTKIDINGTTCVLEACFGATISPIIGPNQDINFKCLDYDTGLCEPPTAGEQVAESMDRFQDGIGLILEHGPHTWVLPWIKGIFG